MPGPCGRAAARDEQMGERAQCDAAALGRGPGPAAVLLCVPEPACRQHRQERRPRRRRAALVDDPGGRLEHDLAAAVPDAAAEVDVLAVHEEPFVEAAELLEHGPPHENAGTG